MTNMQKLELIWIGKETRTRTEPRILIEEVLLPPSPHPATYSQHPQRKISSATRLEQTLGNKAMTKHQKGTTQNKNEYLLEDGMVFEKQYYGKKVRLCVIKTNGVLQFSIDGKLFRTLTAAARYVCGDETRQMSGPLFWNVPVSTRKHS